MTHSKLWLLILVFSLLFSFVVSCGDDDDDDSGSADDDNGGGGDDDVTDDDATDDDATDDDDDDNDDDDGSIQVQLTGDTSVLPGEQLDLSVEVTGECGSPRFLLEQLEIGKTVWQEETVFSVFPEEVGTYQFVAHVMCEDQQYESSTLTVECHSPELTLDADRRSVQPMSGDSVLFQIDMGAEEFDGLELANVASGETYGMYDDGTNGDPVASDNIFSYRFTANLTGDHVPFQATAQSGANTLRSGFFNLFVIEIPTGEEIEAAHDDLAVIEDYSEQNGEGVTVDQFIADFPTHFDGTSQIESIEKSDNYVLIGFGTGARLFLTFTPEGQNPSAAALPKTDCLAGFRLRYPSMRPMLQLPQEKAGEEVFIKSYESLIYSPNHKNRSGMDDGETINELLTEDERFDDHVTWLEDDEVTVDNMTTGEFDWTNYGVIVFFGHGSADGYWVLGEVENSDTQEKYWEDLALGEIALFEDHETDDGWWIFTHHPIVFGTQTSWLADHNDVDLSGTFFYTGACHGGNSIANLFPAEYRQETEEVGSALFGWNNTTHSGSGSNILPARAGDLFEDLLAGHTLADSFDPSWDVNVDGDVVAAPVVYGNVNLLLSVNEAEIFSDDFESYDLDEEMPEGIWDEVENGVNGTSYVRKPTPSDSQAVVFVDPDTESYSHMRVYFDDDVRQGRLDYMVRPSEGTCAGVRFEGDLDTYYWEKLGPYSGVCTFDSTFYIYGYDVPNTEIVNLLEAEAFRWYKISMIFDLDELTYDVAVDDVVVGDDLPLNQIEQAISLRVGTFTDQSSYSNTYFDDFYFVDTGESSVLKHLSPWSGKINPVSELFAPVR